METLTQNSSWSRVRGFAVPQQTNSDLHIVFPSTKSWRQGRKKVRRTANVGHISSGRVVYDIWHQKGNRLCPRERRTVPYKPKHIHRATLLISVAFKKKIQWSFTPIWSLEQLPRVLLIKTSYWFILNTTVVSSWDIIAGESAPNYWTFSSWHIVVDMFVLYNYEMWNTSQPLHHSFFESENWIPSNSEKQKEKRGGTKA